MGRGGGGKQAETPTGTKSLRKGRGKKAASEPEPKNPLEPKRIATNVGVAILLVLLVLLAWRDGGAAQAGGGLLKNVPSIAEWGLYTVAEDGSEHLLCDTPAIKGEEGDDEGIRCSFSLLWAARSSGQECHVKTSVHLASKANPMLLVGLKDIHVNITTMAGRTDFDGEGLNMTSEHQEFTLDWNGGWWWRAFPERVALQFPVPCDAWLYSAKLSLEGRTWTGTGWRDDQVASQVIQTESVLPPANMDADRTKGGNGNATRPPAP